MTICLISDEMRDAALVQLAGLELEDAGLQEQRRAVRLRIGILRKVLGIPSGPGSSSGGGIRVEGEALRVR